MTDIIKKQTIEHFEKIYANFTELFGTQDFFIAGGAIRDFAESFGEPKDYDIFVNDIGNFHLIGYKLRNAGYTVQTERKNSALFIKDGDVLFDLIYIDTSNSKESFGQYIINNFDLTCCCAAIGECGLVHHPDFFKDIDDKEIKINKLKLPYHTYKRIAKHIRKGYSVDPSVLVQVMDFAVEEFKNDKSTSKV
jgi:hypothetical protein